jgi:lipoprotein NlpD
LTARERRAPLLAAAALALAGCLHPAGGATPAGGTPHVEPDVVGVVHVVRRGETVYRIAKTYGLAPDELMEVNGLEDPRQLEVGMELFVPGAMQVLDVVAATEGSTPTATASAQPEPSEAKSKATPTATPTSTASAQPERSEAKSKATPTPTPTSTSTAGKRPPLVAQADRAGLGWPVQGLLYSRYGLRDGQRHDGIDIAAPEGTPVGAAAAGTVVYAGRQSGYGAIVIVRHAAGLLTVYAHASAILVEQGQTVRAGQPIARVGRSGRTTGPHLHFEVREGTRPRNPLLYLP